MTAQAWGQTALYLAVLLTLAWPLALYLSRLFSLVPGSRPAWPLELSVYRLCGVRPDEEMGWQRYSLCILGFSLLGTLVVYGMQRLQRFPVPVRPDSAFNTAVSFVTNTDWQSYSGEATMSHLTQLLGLAVQNFVSAATGIVVAVALIRGFARREQRTVGNFWVDLTRCTLYLLLPLSLIFAVVLAGQGVVQNFSHPVAVHTLEGGSQSLAQGPVASQEAIKMLGTNGGGFFNANSAHPYENPTPLSNFLQMLAIFLIPTALGFAFGHGVGDVRQGWAVLAAMLVLFLLAAGLVLWAEQRATPMLAAAGADPVGGNMEGKETRFGIVASSLFATITTSASCGAVDAMHDSLTPLGGLAPLLLMQLGEVVFGGVGSGLYGMLVFALVAVFVAGLMIGRTPEYLGKKIEAFEMKMASLVILIPAFLVLGGTALAVMTTAGRAGILNPGAHGFSEILYAFSSAANNNGSAFAGLSANTPFYNLTLAVAMALGRFAPMVAVLAIAGALAAKKRSTPHAGSLPTTGPLFVALLVGTVLLVGALTYVPALALGPVVEHLSQGSL